MKNSFVLALLAGLLFGVWPLLMNRSGLSGFMSAGVFAGFCFVFVIPFAIYSGATNSQVDANWKFAVAAGITAALGLLAFNTLLANSEPKSIGPLFVTTLLIQASVPAVYHCVMNGSVSMRQVLGFAATVLAVYLLK